MRLPLISKHNFLHAGLNIVKFDRNLCVVVPDLRISYTSYGLGPPTFLGAPKKIVRVSRCHIYLNVLQHFDFELQIYYFTTNTLLNCISV
jgi:hypothetical protein